MLEKNVIIHAFDFHNSIFNFNYNYVDLETFKKSNKFKILISRENNWTNHHTFDPISEFKKIKEKSEICDLLILWLDELHGFHYNNEGKKNLLSLIKNEEKIYAITGGIITDDILLQKKCKTNLSWLKQCVDIYKNLQFKLDELRPFHNKEYTFDALLGTEKFHRDFVYKKIIESNLTNKIILSYKNDIRSESWFRDQDVNYNLYLENKSDSKIMSSVPIDYYNQKNVMIAHVIPFGIYNKSAFTILTETHFTNGISFPTEKTAKPILAKRLFVAFSGQYFLKSLRSLGFKTFDNIIDESYDEEPDNITRFEKAWKQVEKLLESDQEDILTKIKDIVEHNYNLLINFPFDNHVKNDCTNILTNLYNVENETNIAYYNINYNDNLFNNKVFYCNYEKLVKTNKFKIIGYKDYDYTWDEEEIYKKTQKIIDLSTDCDLLFYYHEDFAACHYEHLNEKRIYKLFENHEKIIPISGGNVNDPSYSKKTINDLLWLYKSTNIYRRYPDELNLLQPYNEKKFYFDALMGLKKPHRQFVYEKIQNSNNKNKFIVSYNNAINNEFFLVNDNLREILKKHENNYEDLTSTRTVNYHNIHTNLSTIIPFEVYNDSSFSIITETFFQYGVFLPSEKIAKPILAKRLFVIFGSAFYLKSLKNLGFATFDNIIDESYDNEVDDFQRWEKAWDQVEKLLSLPQEQIYKKIQPIVEHNFNLIYNMDFEERLKNQINEILQFHMSKKNG